MTNASRRPIAARGRRWAAAGSRALIRTGLAPNQVSLLSIVFAAAACAALVASARIESPAWRAILLIGAAAGIQLRLLCNLFDGLMAVEGGLKTATGDIYNDLPDRLADAMILIGAGYAAANMPYAIEVGWLAAILAIITAYVRVLGAASGAPHDFSGPMAKPHRMAIVTAACALAAIEPLWGWRGQIMIAALVIVCLGCLVTIARRLLHIAQALERRT